MDCNRFFCLNEIIDPSLDKCAINSYTSRGLIFAIHVMVMVYPGRIADERRGNAAINDWISRYLQIM